MSEIKSCSACRTGILWNCIDPTFCKTHDYAHFLNEEDLSKRIWTCPKQADCEFPRSCWEAFEQPKSALAKLDLMPLITNVLSNEPLTCPEKHLYTFEEMELNKKSQCDADLKVLKIEKEKWENFYKETLAFEKREFTRDLEAKEREWKEKTSKMFNPDYLDFQKGVEATKRLWEADKKEWAKKEAEWLDTLLVDYDRCRYLESGIKSHIAELEGKYMDFIPTLGNMIKEIESIILAMPPYLRNNYAKLFAGTELQKLVFSTKDFEEAASEYCRSTGWKEPK